MRMFSGGNFSRYRRPSCYGIFNKDNLHEVHEGPQYNKKKSRMFLHLYKSTQKFIFKFIYHIVDAHIDRKYGFKNVPRGRGLVKKNMARGAGTMQNSAEGRSTIPAPSSVRDMYVWLFGFASQHIVSILPQSQISRVCIVGNCWQWANFTIGPNEQNQHFAELRQKVCSYKHVVLLLRCLPSLDSKLERFVTKKWRR